MCGCRCAQAARGEFENRFDVIPCQSGVKLDQFVDSHTIFKVFENGRNRHPRIAEYPRAADFSGDAFHGWALRPIEGSRMAAGRFRKSVERLGKQIVRVLKLAALDAFPHPAFDFRLVNFEAHGLPAVIVSQDTLPEKPFLPRNTTLALDGSPYSCHEYAENRDTVTPSQGKSVSF